MIDYARRAAAGTALLALGHAQRNRRRYGPAPGLRIAALHAEDTDVADALPRLADMCLSRLDAAGPADVDALWHGDAAAGRDRLLLTMDDGHARTFPAAEQLAKRGLRIIYFVVPSYIGRTIREYLEFHRRRGVDAFDIGGPLDRDRTCGLSVSQLRELEAMGHRIGAHNDAHRNLAQLDDAGMAYEIDGALDRLADLLGHPVEDFAWAFGRVEDAPPAALALMRRRCRRVYSSVRGLNVPGVTPAVLLRDPLSVHYPAVFNRACIEGALDHHYAGAHVLLQQQAGSLPAGPA